MDIKSAFRLLRVRPQDFHLLGFYFEGNYYIDKCLPFECSVSCKTFEKFATFLEWVVRDQSGIHTVHHYLDDYVFIGTQHSNACITAMTTFEYVCNILGIPLNEDKTEGPTTRLTFLGLMIDTVAQTISIPEDKIADITLVLNDFLSRNKVLLKELQSLAGKLNFISRAVRGSRAFIRRFYDAMIGYTKPHHHIRLTKSIKEDIVLWLSFLNSFNGVIYFPEICWSTNETLHLYTDSAGGAHLGCGAMLGNHWVYLPWPGKWANSEILRDITFLELVPIVLALSLWKTDLHKKRILFHTDNSALVSIINCQSSKSKRTMSLLRPMVLTLMTHNITFKSLHIMGKLNNAVDAISRMQWSRFRAEAPEADEVQTPVPAEFLRLLLAAK